MTLNPVISITGLEQARFAFGAQVVNRAINSTVNKVAAQTRTAIIKEVRKSYAVKAAAVREATTVRRSAFGENEAFVFGTGTRIPLRDFGARKTRRGVTLRIKKVGGRKRLPHAFVVRSIGGHVFGRTGEPKRATRRGRYAGTGILREPIKKMVGRAIPQMIGTEDVLQRILAHADSITPRIFEHELRFRLSRGGQ